MKEYTFNKWHYDIKKNKGKGLKSYGWNIYIFKNYKLIYSNGAYGSKNIALSDIEKYIIEHEFKIDLNEYQTIDN